MKPPLNTAPHLTAASLIVVLGIFIFNIQTGEDYKFDAVYGFRNYGYAVLIIGISFFLLTAWKALEELSPIKKPE